jgi:hypothetical protein
MRIDYVRDLRVIVMYMYVYVMAGYDDSTIGYFQVFFSYLTEYHEQSFS